MKKLGKGCLITFGVVVLLFIVLGIFAALSGSDTSDMTTETASVTESVSNEIPSEDSKKSQATLPTQEAEKQEIIPTKQPPTKDLAVTTEAPPVDNAPTFNDICSNSTLGGQTELVWDNYKEEVVSKYFVNRLGEVTDVSQGLLGGYTLIVNVGKSYGPCGIVVHIDVTEEEANNIQVGQRMLFSGKVSSLAEFLGDIVINLDEASYVTDEEKVKAVAQAIQPPLGKIGEEIKCGESFLIKILEAPEFVSAMGYGNRAVGKYLVLKLEIVNTGKETVQYMDEGYFNVEGSINDNTMTFASNWDPSYYAVKRQGGYKLFSEDIPPGLPFKTQVVFDVNPEAKNMVFVFTPKENLFDSNYLCEVRVDLNP